MSGDLERYVGGGEAVPPRDRRMVKHARRIYNEVRLEAFEATATEHLTTHLIKAACEIVDAQRALVGDDPAKELLTAPFVQYGIVGLQAIQARQHDHWRL